MKTKKHRSVLSLLALLALGLFAAPVHAQGEKKKTAGPNGGRILAGPTPRAEFFVTPDRKVRITFLDAAGKPVAPAAQVVTVTTGERTKPTTLAFAPDGNGLLSTAALPAGNTLPTVVQIKPTPDGRLVTEKFNVDLSKCGDCKLAEYACICGH